MDLRATAGGGDSRRRDGRSRSQYLVMRAEPPPSKPDRRDQDAIHRLGELRDDGTAEPKQERRWINEFERDFGHENKISTEETALMILSKVLQAICHDGEDA